MKIELSLQRELNPEGWRGVRNEINLDLFSRAALEPTVRGPITVFLSALGGKGSQSGAQWAPISIKNRLKVVSGIHLVSPWLPDAPQGGPWAPKVPKSDPQWAPKFSKNDSQNEHLGHHKSRKSALGAQIFHDCFLIDVLVVTISQN